MAGEEVGVLYICTGQYRVYWEEFYKTAEAHFLPGHSKHYYVWSNYPVPEAPNVTFIVQPWEGWPDETLKRFHRFLLKKEALLRHKYLYYLNANVRFLSDVGDEVLPDETHKLVAAVHALFWKPAAPGEPVECKGARRLLEQRVASLACVPDADTHDYIMGGFNGGFSEAYIEMAATLKARIDLDCAQGIIAKYNDESHMNHYSMTHAFKLLPPSYLYPEGFDIQCDPKVVVIDKGITFRGFHFRDTGKMLGTGMLSRLKKLKNNG